MCMLLQAEEMASHFIIHIEKGWIQLKPYKQSNVCEIRGFYGGGGSSRGPLGCDAV
jgi:hypothetical protein